MCDNPAQGASTECLGGRAEFTNIPVGAIKNYNLWIRGPAGANGGTAAVCKKADPTIHDQLRVERGGSYAIRAYLKNTGSAPVQVEVDVAHYFDQYQYKEVEGVISCAPKPFSGCGELNSPSCPETFEQCRPECGGAGENCLYDRNADWVLLPHTCEAKELDSLGKFSALPNELTCTERNQVDIRADSAYCIAPSPPNADCAEGVLDDGNCAAAWIAEPEQKRARVGSIPYRCESAAEISSIIECDLGQVYGYKPVLESCPNLVRLRDEIAQDTIELNKGQPEGAERFSPEALFSWLPPSGESWEFSWTAKDELGRSLSEARNELRINPQSITPTTLYKSNSGHISEEILAELKEGADRGSDDFGWSEFLRDFSSNVKLELVSSQPVLINQVPPFNEAVRELYYGQTNEGGAWDFDRDCQADSACPSLAKKFASEEELIRYLASAQVPQAADSRYYFAYQKEFGGIEHFEADSLADAQAIDLPACTPTRMICSDSPAEDAEVIYLGISDDEPEVCRNNTYHNCFSRPLGSSVLNADSNEVLDLELAKRIGLSELRRIFPSAYLAENCKGASACSSIEIDAENGPRARVSVRHSLDLGFPFNLMTGQDSVEIAYTKEEVMERAFAGRQ